jgi:hypothetical protein
MYTLTDNEVKTFSLSDPDKPQLINQLLLENGLETIIIYEGTGYIGSTTALYILDLSDPAAPKLSGRSERTARFIGGCDPVVVRNNYAYSTIKIIENICGRVNQRSALVTYDVTDKTAPLEVSATGLSQPNGLGYQGKYLFVCDEGSDRLEVFDLTRPDRPTIQPQLSIPMTDPFDLIVNDNKMIVSTKTAFQVYDISALPVIRPLTIIQK